MSGLLLAVVDSSPFFLPQINETNINLLAAQLGKTSETEGFAYLVNIPLTFSHDRVFATAKSFFQCSQADKLRLVKKSFQRNNSNAYRE